MKIDEKLHPLNIEHFFRKFIIDRAAELWNGKELRKLLIYGLFLSIIFLFILLKFAPKNYITTEAFFLGCILGVLWGIYMNFHFSNRIKNNLYPMERIFSFKKIILGVLIILGLDILTEFYKLNFFYLLFGIALPVSISISLSWLIKYEKKNGTVYILLKTKDD